MVTVWPLTAAVALALSLVGLAAGSRSTTDARASADIAFIGRNLQLWVTSADGFLQRQLTFGPMQLSEFRWSPNGRRIAFVSFRDLYVVNAAGGEPRRLARSHGSGLSWSPDSRQIAYGQLDARGSEARVVNVAGGGARSLAPDLPETQAPSWSPDGTRIAFSVMRFSRQRYRSDVYTTPPDGNRLQRLTRTGLDHTPFWSPDGRSIFFYHSIVCSSGAICRSRMYVMRLDGSGRRRLVLPRGISGLGVDPSWSPDGRRVAVEFRRKGRGNEVAVVEVGTAKMRVLTKNMRDASRPSWSPDGRRIIFTHRGALHVMNADGSGVRALPVLGGSAAWRPKR